MITLKLITIDGHLGSANADVSAGSSAKVMAVVITEDAASTGVSATLLICIDQ